MLREIIFVVLISFTSVMSASETIKIITAVPINETVLLFESKQSRDVAYVYPVEPTYDIPDCIYSVIENSKPVYYNVTKGELLNRGKVPAEELCVGDTDNTGKKFSKSDLFALCCS